MKKSTWLLLLLLLAFLEQCLVYILPLDYRYTGYSFVPHFVLITVLLFVKDMESTDRILWGTVTGLLYGLLFTPVFWYTGLFFALAAYLIGWTKTMRTFWKVLSILGLCFLYDALPTFFFMFLDQSGSLFQFLIYMELPSLLLALISLWVLNTLLAHIEPGYRSLFPAEVTP